MPKTRARAFDRAGPFTGSLSVPTCTGRRASERELETESVTAVEVVPRTNQSGVT